MGVMRIDSKLFAYIILMIPSVTMAALPPSAESLRRIKAVAESPAVFERIGSSDLVTGISQTKEGYVVMTNRCKLRVSIQETKLSEMDPGLVGPPKLDVVVGELKCQRRR